MDECNGRLQCKAPRVHARPRDQQIGACEETQVGAVLGEKARALLGKRNAAVLPTLLLASTLCTARAGHACTRWNHLCPL